MPSCSAFANRAVDHGLRQVARRRGIWRKPARTSSPKGTRSTTFTHDRWSRPIAAGDIVPAVVTAVDGKETRNPRRRASGSDATRRIWRARRISGRGGRTHPSWSSPAISIDVGIVTLEDAGKATVTLEQQPLLEGALSPSTTAPGRFSRWSAASASRAASSIARRRRTGSWDPRSSRFSTPRPSIAA